MTIACSLATRYRQSQQMRPRAYTLSSIAADAVPSVPVPDVGGAPWEAPALLAPPPGSPSGGRAPFATSLMRIFAHFLSDALRFPSWQPAMGEELRIEQNSQRTLLHTDPSANWSFADTEQKCARKCANDIILSLAGTAPKTPLRMRKVCYPLVGPDWAKEKCRPIATAREGRAWW